MNISKTTDSRRSPEQGLARRSLAAATLAAFLTTGPLAPLYAASLSIGPEVVVKFGADAGLQVAAPLEIREGATLTSIRDDRAGGVTAVPPQAPQAGDWQGIRVNAGVPGTSLKFGQAVIRYAATGLAVEGIALPLTGTAFEFNQIGLQASGGASPNLTGGAFAGNGIGLWSNGATPNVAGSSFQGNTSYAAQNQTPGSVVLARGNWWGDASGPRDAIGNPAGKGDTVSTGVDYGIVQAAPPLLGCRVAPADGNFEVRTPAVRLRLSCRHATQYRLSGSTDFGGISFQPFAGDEVVSFPVNGSPGARNAVAEFKSDRGQTLRVALDRTLSYNPNAPTVSFVTPPENAELTGDTRLVVNATDDEGITQVEFRDGETSLGVVTTPPYEWPWSLANVPNGVHGLRALATNRQGAIGEAGRAVRVNRSGSDTTGPDINRLEFRSKPLEEGQIISSPGKLSFSLVDPSNIGTVTVSIDGKPVTGQLVNGTGAAVWSGDLDFAEVADGAHGLTISATDVPGNRSELIRRFVLALPAPIAAPVITAPANHAVVDLDRVSVSGTAPASGLVQLYVDGQPTGPRLIVADDGQWHGTAALPSEGVHTLTADAQNSRGKTPQSAPVSVDYQRNGLTISFTQPAADGIVSGPVELEAAVQHTKPIRELVFKRDGAVLTTLTAEPYRFTWDTTTLAPGNYVLSAVVTDTVDRTATALRNVQIAASGDRTGPEIKNLLFRGAALQAGDTLTQSGPLSFTASDPSGVASATATFDGQSLSLAGSGTSASPYTAELDLSKASNGSKVLQLTATDKLGNASTVSLNLAVNLPVPTVAPAFTAPEPNSTVTTATIAVLGTAPADTQVQLYLDGNALGGLLPVSANGRWSGSVAFGSEGTHQIRADARNARGTSPLSAELVINYLTPGPTVAFVSPVDDATLVTDTVIALNANAVVGLQSVQLLANGQPLATLTTPPYHHRWPVSQLPGGRYTLQAIATDVRNRTTSVTRIVTIDHTPPALPTPYLTEVTSVTPPVSYGEQPIVITGQVKGRDDGRPIANAALKLVLRIGNFQRKIPLAADAAGNFSYRFKPLLSDAGRYRVAVVHPEEKAIPDQAQFILNRVSFSASRAVLKAVRGFAQPFRLYLSASDGQGSDGVQLSLEAAAQPSGTLPAGIGIVTPGPVNVPAGSQVPIDLTFNSTATSPETGPLILTLRAAASGSVVRSTLRIDYQLYAAAPTLTATPAYIETGVAQGSQITETFILENKGLVAADQVQAKLIQPNGSAPPNWVWLASAPELGTLAPGAKPVLQITAQPPAGIADGIYQYRVRVIDLQGDTLEVPVAVSVRQAGQGAVRFQVADIYTNTLDAQGQRIAGVAGTTVKLQHETVPSLTAEGVTAADGSLTLTGLTPGRYRWRATAPQHDEAGGRLTIKPGVTVSQEVFLDYRLISIEWSVVETTVQDRYDVALHATYQTEVPAPVVLLEPLSVDLPDLQVGEELTGELTLTNYGLVRADNLVFTPPPEDEYYRYEFLVNLPTSLEAKQRVALPYRITVKKLLPGLEPKRQLALLPPKQLLQAKSSKVGGCFSYQNNASVIYDYSCANGDRRVGDGITRVLKLTGNCSGSAGPIALGSARCLPGSTDPICQDAKGDPPTQPGLPLTKRCMPGCNCGGPGAMGAAVPSGNPGKPAGFDRSPSSPPPPRCEDNSSN